MPISELLALAEQHRAAGRLFEAEGFCRRVLEAQPNEPNAVHLLALIAHQSGKLGEAIAHLQRATALAPNVALFQANLGEMCRLAGRIDEAIVAGRRAVELEPRYPQALSNLGAALYERKDYQEAAACHRRAIAVAPDFALAHSNLGNALHALKRYDEAIDAYRRALALDPNFADAWSNLGTTLHHAGRYEEGIAALRRALALAPQHANAHSGLGILLLMRGDLAEGWDEYEWRLLSSEVKGPRFPQRPWQGESLAGRHIYVQAEQGFGDTIQFARYLPMLKARAGKVSFRMHQSLLTLMRENLPGIELYGDRGTPAAADVECALLSLPRLFRTRLETIPAPVGYLRAPPEIAARWREQLRDMSGLKVGLVWAGRPEHANDHRRSLDLAALAPLAALASEASGQRGHSKSARAGHSPAEGSSARAALPGVSFASLQVGPHAADVARNSRMRIVDLSAKLTDFSDTAGAIEALDLVITVDTAVAHLAGALGKPTWVLLPEVNDWRWLLEREDNPWYPTMRLFRTGKGAWPDVIARVVAELGATAAGDRARLTPFREAGERRAALAAEIIATEALRVTTPQPAQTLTPEQALMLAEQQRQAGRLGEAEDLCRRILAAQPRTAEAEHLLGIIAHQSGRLPEAIEHVARAAEIDGKVALYRANLGEMYRLSGRPDRAAEEARRALAINPDYPGALSNLGIALYEQGQYEDALGCYDRAVALEANFADAHSNRGNALRALKRLPEAEAAYRRALELNPRFAQAWNNLGTTLRELKRPQDAEEAYRKALAENPNDPDTLDNLALAVKDLERTDEAIGLLQAALASEASGQRGNSIVRAPDTRPEPGSSARAALTIETRAPNLYLHLGSMLIDRGRVDEAAAALERVLALKADDHDAINLMGRVAFERGELEGALAHYRRALALKRDLPDALNNMGNVLKELGQLDEARAAFLEALALDPKNTGVYVNLADSKKFAAGDPHLEAMQALEHEGNLSPTERTQINFALGKAYADLKDHDRSFEHLIRANAGKRAQIKYDEAATLGLFERIEQLFTSALVERKARDGDPSRLPIFVIGMPRSGTTLVEQILASHPQVHGAGELKVMNDIADTVQGVGTQGVGSVRIPYPDFVPALDAAAMRAVGARYVAALRKLAPGARRAGERSERPARQLYDARAGHSPEGGLVGARVTDKMPSNFFFAGLIHLALPNAPIIHTVRDPVDTCVSCFSKLFTAEQNHTYDLAELGRYHRRYQRLMAHWHRVLPAGSILDVRYEDVVADLEGQARRIIAHCGLDWDARCLAFHRTERPVRTASATQVRQPIYSSAVGRWRVYEPYLGPLLAELGKELL